LSTTSNTGDGGGAHSCILAPSPAQMEQHRVQQKSELARPKLLSRSKERDGQKAGINPCRYIENLVEAALADCLHLHLQLPQKKLATLIDPSQRFFASSPIQRGNTLTQRTGC
jgi:hypothetical protein